MWQDAAELQFLDIDIRKGLPFPTNSADVIFSSHALEHFTYYEAVVLLFEIHRVLKIGAPLCLVVPDMDIYVSRYVNRDHAFLMTPEIIGGQPQENLAANFLMNFYSDPRFNNTCHKYAYGFENLSSMLRLVGFEQIERVGFHEFSYWPELAKAEFKSQIAHIEEFSLCVQCRKIHSDSNFRARPEFIEARTFSRSGLDGDPLQEIHTLLVLNDGLKRQNLQVKHEADEARSSVCELREKIRQLETRAVAAEAEWNSKAATAEAEWKLRTATAEAEWKLRVAAAEAELNKMRKRLGEESKRAKDLMERLRAAKQRMSELNSLEESARRAVADSEQRIGALLELNAAMERRGGSRFPRQDRALAPFKNLVWFGRYVTFYCGQRFRSSPEFDGQWYRRQYPDVGRSRLDPLLHYLFWGAAEGRNPSPNFDTKAYLRRNPDVARARVNPLVHYIQIGAREGRAFGGPGFSPAVSDHAANARAARRAVELSASAELPVASSAAQYAPLVSVLMPVFNTPARFLADAIRSVRRQSYQNWELCIVDDASTNRDCVEALRAAAGEDSRITVRFRDRNGGIAVSSQEALEMAKGEIVAFLDHDDILLPNAIAQVAAAFAGDPVTDMIYTDHVMIDSDGTLLSHSLKPGWSPEFFLSTNYLVHFKAIRRKMLLDVGGFSGTIHTAQDTAISCKLLEHGARIKHLPKVLYYWRMHSQSVASGTSAKRQIETAAVETYNAFFRRKGVNATVEWPEFFRTARIGAYKLRFPKTSSTKVAVVIPVVSRECDFRRLLRSYAKTKFSPLPAVHVIGPKALPSDADAEDSVLLRRADTQREFDEAVVSLDAETLVFVSPGARLLSSEWLRELLGYLCVSNEIGAVGGKVLDDRLCVRTGGILLLNEFRPVSAGLPDKADGYWFTNKIASNVEAISARFFATPKALYQQVGGAPFLEYPDAAGIEYCLKLRNAGYRIVYNPWAKMVDPVPEDIPSGFRARLAAKFGEARLQDQYYHPFFSRESPYTIV